jgi:catechol 2,3-dioxygenase
MVTEQIVLDDGSTPAAGRRSPTRATTRLHPRPHRHRGPLHHIAFATDTREDILRAADIALEQGVFIETGPHKHAIQQTFFLYVYEPGGNRIELCNAGARLVLAPDWQPSTGPRPSGQRARRGAARPSRRSTPTAPPPVREHR